MNKLWKEKEIEFLKKNYETKTRSGIASSLGRSEQSIKNKVKELGLSKKKELVIDKNYIRENFENTTIKNLAKKFGCDSETMKKICENLGLSKEYKEIEIGTRFGKLITSSKEYRFNNKIVVDCICDCGNERKSAHRTTLFTGETWNCGCERKKPVTRKITKPRPRKYEEFKTKHKLYSIWKDCKRRSGVCEEWIDYNNFYDWAIKIWKEGLVIYRKDINKVYSVQNSIFITTKEFKKRIFDINPDIYEKIRKTNISKYGYGSPLSSKEIQNKIQKTNLERYGKKHFTETKYFIEKSKETCLEKYGVEHYSQTEDCKEKRKEACLKKYGVDHQMKSRDFVNELIEKNKENGVYKLIDGKTISEWSKKIGIHQTSLRERVDKYGEKIAITKPKKISGIEIIMSDLLDKLGIEYKKGQIIDKKIPDFLIEDHKLIIECDGLYWHSEAKKDKYYHKEKREVYLKNGYTPLFFYEDEIIKKVDIIESIIKNKLGKSERIFGRKCNIVELNTKTSSNFCDKNHLMGKGSGKGFGLYYENKLVCVMRLTKKKNGLDISRFCCKNGYNVIGGFSKLLKYVIKTISPAFIQTFTDLRYGSGEYLKDMGFNIESESLSFNWIKDDYRLHRLSFPSNSGYKAGFIKMWDCGQRKWVLYNN